jgi:hypothetical protein
MTSGEKWLPVLFAVSLLLCLIQLNCMLIAASISGSAEKTNRMVRRGCISPNWIWKDSKIFAT